MADDSPQPSVRENFLTLFSLASALVILWFPLASVARDGSFRAVAHRVPIHGVNAAWVEQWRFLAAAGKAVPPGTTYTVRAGDLQEEMSLFMLSLDLLERRTPFPTSYFGQVFSTEGGRAEYVLAYRCIPLRENRIELVAEVPGGCVWRRSGVPR